MILFVAALLPVVIYIIVVYQIDNFSLISVKRLLLLILCGMLTALACFALFQLTGKIIPESQSDSVNPIIEERKHHPLLPPAEGIGRFLDYARGCVLLGHNADYDYHILRENMARYLNGKQVETATNDWGDFWFRKLSPGRYTVTIDVSGPAEEEPRVEFN